MNIVEIEKTVAKIQTHLFKNSNSYAIGMLKSHFRGAGIQFKEHQVYNPGDDVRFIDWKLSAKSNHTYVKTFEEERNIEITIVVDISQTMFMGYKNTTKLQAALEITSLMYLLAEKTKDIVRVVIARNNELINLPPLSGRKGIALLISLLEKNEILNQSGQVNLQYAQDNTFDVNDKIIGIIKGMVARKKEVILLSDFSNVTDLKILEKLSFNRNMHTFNLTTPMDKHGKVPFSIFTKFQNKSKVINIKSKGEKKRSIRWKEINLSKRYLEEFIGEML